MDPRTPVIIGSAQHIWSRGHQPAPEPLDGWEEACRLAAADAGISTTELSGADFITLADSMSWIYDDAIARFCDRLSASPRGVWYSEPSGVSGHKMMAKAVDAIRNGGAELALISGGESLATRRYFARRGETPAWSHPAPADRPLRVDLEADQHPGEAAIGLFEGVGAVCTFAMRELARRAHLGIAPDVYRAQIGDLLSGLTRVAADNPNAWFPVARTSNYLITPRADNRMIAYPYTKNMVSIIDVDMYGALIVASTAKADALGIPHDRRIYPWAFCAADDPIDTGVRPNLWKSEAIVAASGAVLRAAGKAIEEIAHIDVYSCFGAAVNFARDALNIPDRPGDRMTVTGGLPYAGGPASSYVITSLVRMVERLRSDPGSFGLISGLGMMMSNHGYSLYSAEPPQHVAAIDEAGVQTELRRVPLLPITDRYAGPAKVATYTVMHDREGAISHGAAICDLPDGSRAYARILDKGLLQEGESTELIGRELQMVEGERVGELYVD